MPDNVPVALLAEDHAAHSSRRRTDTLKNQTSGQVSASSQ
jgi:hypothetical protein